MTIATDPFLASSLDGLIAQAEADGKWLFSHYQQVWFSPAELRAANANGRFRWGAINWQLRDPQERLQQLERAVADAVRERDTFQRRMTQETPQ